MTVINKIIQATVRSCRATPMTRVSYSCPGGDKKDGDDPCCPCDLCDPCDPCNCCGKKDQEESSKPCPVCQCPSDYNPSTPTMYDCRKYGHCLPSNNVRPCFEVLPNIPTGIFRCTDGEVLGHGAAKGSYYQNPEYFSFQHMTFYDMHLILRCCRIPSPRTDRKP